MRQCWWGEGSSRLQPACALLSSGNLTALAWDNGTVRLKLGGEELLHSRPGQWYAPAGISAFVRTADGLLTLRMALLCYSRLKAKDSAPPNL